jgi:hypothetical protein
MSQEDAVDKLLNGDSDIRLGDLNSFPKAVQVASTDSIYPESREFRLTEDEVRDIFEEPDSLYEKAEEYVEAFLNASQMRVHSEVRSIYDYRITVEREE